MSRAKSAAILGLAASILGGYVAWDRYLSPEARVRRALAGAGAAAETADVDAFLSFLSHDFADFRHPSRGGLEATMREGFGRVERLNVTLDPVEVEVDGPEALAVVDAVIVAIRGEERFVVFGQPFQPERLHVRLRREEGGWKIHRVELPSP